MAGRERKAMEGNGRKAAEGRNAKEGRSQGRRYSNEGSMVRKQRQKSGSKCRRYFTVAWLQVTKSGRRASKEHVQLQYSQAMVVAVVLFQC